MTDPLTIARTIDPHACYPSGLDHEDGCLLVGTEYADAVVALIPGSYEDPNDPPTETTRIVYPESTEDREPSDHEIYNRSGMEGGIPYDITPDTRDEHDPTL